MHVLKKPSLASDAKVDFVVFLIFIGPRCPWSDLCVRMSQTNRRCVDLTDVTLADEDTNSILTDNANRAIQVNVATN